jgi:hypothetical protein
MLLVGSVNSMPMEILRFISFTSAQHLVGLTESETDLTNQPMTSTENESQDDIVGPPGAANQVRTFRFLVVTMFTKRNK